MATYTYTAKRRGAPFTGEAMADNKAAVVAQLRHKGLTVIKLEEKRKTIGLKEAFENSQRIKIRDKAIFARQFSTMINSVWRCCAPSMSLKSKRRTLGSRRSFLP